MDDDEFLSPRQQAARAVAFADAVDAEIAARPKIVTKSMQDLVYKTRENSMIEPAAAEKAQVTIDDVLRIVEAGLDELAMRAAQSDNALDARVKRLEDAKTEDKGASVHELRKGRDAA